MDEKRLSLDGIWQINYLSEEKYRTEETKPHTTAELSGFGEGEIPGRVPGNFELDLEREGILPEIFQGTNPLLLQKYEGYHVYYSRRFQYEEEPGRIPVLVFEGIDTIGEIWLNGELLARTDNMFIPYRFEPSNLIQGENELVVHLFPVCMETRKNEVCAGNSAVNKYNFESLRLRKAAHMFGWDIMPRMVSCGIFRPVYLSSRPDEYIKQAYLMTASVDVWKHSAELLFFYEFAIQASDLSEYSVELTGELEESRFAAETRLWYTAGRFGVHVDHARLWWPKGYGGPELYEVTVKLKYRGCVLDEKVFRTGLRTVSLERTSTTDSFFSGKFQFRVNGKKIFILGTNFVPIDAFHSRDRERLPKVCELLQDSGCNAIRIWGGNVYEDDYLYDFCDRSGILIWQDFMMACAIYPNDAEFGTVIAAEVKTIVRRLRHHPSILLWAGDNEVDQGMMFQPYPANPNRNQITRKYIPEVLEYEDPVRPYLPSSPYIDEEAAKTPMEYLPENHLWGPRDYFRSTFYTSTFASFASELGYHGCPGVESIYKFIPEGEAWPWPDNPAWAVHAASPETPMIDTWGWRIHLMADQIKEMFGEIPETIEKFALGSQISQAEAFKFFIELFRTEKGKRTGIIWWNLIDGWPQFSDAVVDYYYCRKLAYYYIRQVQKPLLLSFTAPLNWQIVLKAVNDTGEILTVSWKVTDYASGKEIGSGVSRVGDDVIDLASVRYSHGDKKIYLIEWECGELSGKNHYLCGEPPFDLKWYEEFIETTYHLDCWIRG